MANRHGLAINRIAGGWRCLGRQVGDDLVPKEIKIHPLG